MADRRIRELAERLNRLQIEQNQVARELRALQQEREEERRRTTRGTGPRTDRDGRIIFIANRVRYLTPGRYTSTEGTVVRFTRRFVVTEDDRGNIINREPRNVRVIPREEYEQRRR